MQAVEELNVLEPRNAEKETNDHLGDLFVKRTERNWLSIRVYL